MTHVVSLQTFKREEGEAHEILKKRCDNEYQKDCVVMKFDIQQTADVPAKGHLVKL